MEKTLTSLGIQKIGQRFVDSVDHIAYTLSGKPVEAKPIRKIADSDSIRIYVYFDASVSGTVAGVRLIDQDGDIIAENPQEITLSEGRGFYTVFKYQITEVAT